LPGRQAVSAEEADRVIIAGTEEPLSDAALTGEQEDRDSGDGISVGRLLLELLPQ